MDEIIKPLIISLPFPAIIVVFVLWNPEKVEIWSSLFYKLLSNIGGMFSFAHKKYVKHDLQGRINKFVKSTSKNAPFFDGVSIQVNWVDIDVDKKAFIDKGKVILRLKRDDPEDMNFVHGAYWSVSTGMLTKVKRYIAPTQRQALDLYVTAKVIEKEKMGVTEYFMEEYLLPHIGDPSSKTAQLYEKFNKIDRYGVFYPILLQELDFISKKIYGGPQRDEIIAEVTRLIDFLNRVAERKLGANEVDLEFLGKYSRFGIVIVGKAAKINAQGSGIYIKYIEREVLPQKAETVYLLGKVENDIHINEICEHFKETFEIFKTHRYTGHLKTETGTFEQKVYLAVLRTFGISIYQPKQ